MIFAFYLGVFPLNTGLKKTKRKGKVMSIIQEDRQGFGWLLSKDVNLEMALKYPITSVPPMERYETLQNIYFEMTCLVSTRKFATRKCSLDCR